MNVITLVKEQLALYGDSDKAEFLPRFFKTGPGDYGEGDRFIGVTVPNQRKVAKRHAKAASLSDISDLLAEPVHEHRLTAIFMLVYKFEKASEQEKSDIVDMYLSQTANVNNWDLVDSSADKILGVYLLDKDRSILYQLAESPNLWEQRIAVIATFAFIRKNQFNETLNLAERLLDHKHDLIHKAVGWMLREVGKRDFAVEYDFLSKHYSKMPRTMLRYAIEKFAPELRAQFLQGTITTYAD